MTERAALARWPRLMSEADAAEYVGVSVGKFRLEREAGIWPPPVQRGCRRNTFDRIALDAAVDRLSEYGISPQANTFWAERLNGRLPHQGAEQGQG